jgi:crotonobetainyl-CoA:carnitine CoA-transferase CaiB-like acyl-CoA transferase
VKTKEGKEIFTTAASDKEWMDARLGYIDEAVKDHVEYTKVLNDPKLNNPFGRIDNLEKLIEIVKYAASKTTYQQFQQAKGVLCGAVNTRDSMLQVERTCMRPWEDFR